MPSILFYFPLWTLNVWGFCHIQEGKWFQKGMVIDLEVSCYYSVKNSALACL